MTTRYEIICISTGSCRSLLSEDELAYRCGIHPGLAARLRAIGLIAPEREEEPFLYPPAAVMRLRRMLRLRKDLGVNYAAAGIIADLLERIDDLEEKVRKYEKGR